ncbi:hypothetical protein BASA81_007150 [Batrachochytrium salamandrivorans]|nr:hypothetical protein BASA81_007150 [Batrachochytrium salamandrivorans]
MQRKWLVAWLIVALLCATLRTLLFVHTLSVLLESSYEEKRDQTLTRLAKLRVGMELAAGSIQLLFVILSSNHVASSQNGASPLLFSLYLLFIAFGQLLDVQVMVKLGRRMLPFAANWTHGMVYPNEVWVLQTGLALMLGYILCTSLFMCWQLSRCVWAIRALSLNVQDIKIQRSIQRFRAMQGMIYTFTGVATTCIVLLIHGTLPFHWYVLAILFMWGELVFESAMVWTTFPKRQHTKPVTDLLATGEEEKPRMVGMTSPTLQPSATN